MVVPVFEHGREFLPISFVLEMGISVGKPCVVSSVRSLAEMSVLWAREMEILPGQGEVWNT